MSEDVFKELKEKFLAICNAHGLLAQNVKIEAHALDVKEAIGDPEGTDFPLQKGKETLMQADFMGSFGQAFSDRYGDFDGFLKNIIEMPLNNNYRRAIFVATLNAVMRYLNQTDRTVHCKDSGPSECAAELAEYIKNKYGPVRITQAGFQPRMVETLAQEFPYRLLDLDPDNIGARKFGVLIEGAETVLEAIDWADLLLVTGTTLVNGTIGAFLVNTPVLFYGTTIAGAADLMKWDRFCARST